MNTIVFICLILFTLSNVIFLFLLAKKPKEIIKEVKIYDERPRDEEEERIIKQKQKQRQAEFDEIMKYDTHTAYQKKKGELNE